jgi:phosphatidylglycerophosphate synthase
MEGSCLALSLPVGRGPALDWLLESGKKSQDGFMARNFDRRLSLALSRLLLETSVTPNMMTLASSLIGLAGTFFFLAPNQTSAICGAVLVWLHSVLDGCDGELARIRFQESPLGASIDFWGDNLVHLSLFGCLAIGFFRTNHGFLPLALGLAASLGTLGSAALVYRQKARQLTVPYSAGMPPPKSAEKCLSPLEQESPSRPSKEKPGISAAFTRIENLLAARDFIYLLVLLACFDRTYEFLWAGAIGSLLFFIMMLYLGRIEYAQTRKVPASCRREIGSPSPGYGSSHQHVYSGR